MPERDGEALSGNKQLPGRRRGCQQEDRPSHVSRKRDRACRFERSRAGRVPCRSGWSQTRNTESLAARIGEMAHALALDISDPRGVATGFDRIEARFGRLALLFKNAGAREPSQTLLEDVDAESFQRGVATNLSGAF